MSQRFGWTLSGLPLVTDPDERPSSGWWLETYADGFDLGSPEGREVVRESLLLDGDDERIDRYGNRSMSWVTAVCGYTFDDLAQGHRALTLVTGGPGELVLTPPGDGLDTLFDVRTSQIGVQVNDLEWMQPNIKYLAHRVTVKAAPWAYSTESVTETFTTGSATVTVVDTGSSAANWPGMSVDSYLGETTVALGPVEATYRPHGSFVDINTGTIGHYTGGSWACSGTIRYSAAIAGSTPYIFVDLAVEGNQFTSGITFNMTGAASSVPVGFEPQSNGYTRYIFHKPSGTGFQLHVSIGAPQGQSATFHVNQMGTITAQPSGSLLGLSMEGSVPVYGQLQISHPSSGQLGEVMVYSDPTMLSHGWVPDDYSTWDQAPEGTWWLYVQPNYANYAVGDVFGYTISGQTQTTRTEWAGVATPTNGRWFPIGPFHLGTYRSRRLGSIGQLLADDLTLTRNGVNMGSTSPVRLFREDEDAALLHVRDITVDHLFIDPPTFDQLRPGVFSSTNADGTGASSVLSTTDSQQWPVLTPGATALAVIASGTTTPTVTSTGRAAHHTFRAA